MGPTTQPLRVLYVARAPFISGAERALLSMLRHLDRRAVAPAVVLGHETDMQKLVHELDLPVYTLALPKRGLGTLLHYWRSLARLTRAIRQFKPHLLHANDVPSCQAMSEVGKHLSLPRVIHVRWQITAGDAAWWARGGAERLVCISQWMKQEVGDTAGTALASARVEVIPDAVDWPATVRPGVEGAGPAGSEPAAARPPRDLVLGFAGQLIQSKGLDLVIQALGRLPAESRPRLLVAGEDTQSGGAYQRQLKDVAQECGVADRVQWLGFLPDVGQLYRQVDAVVCPSRIEPLGLVPLEAARYHLPALASRVGGLAETIQDGATGWLAEPTIEGWVAAIPRLFDEPARRRLGQTAHQRTRTGYSPMVYQQRLMELYRTLVHS